MGQGEGEGMPKGEGLEGKELQEGGQKCERWVSHAGGTSPLCEARGDQDRGQGLMPESHFPGFPLRLDECDQILAGGSCCLGSQSALGWRNTGGEKEGN